jgi:hypothetical protein
MLAAVCRGKTNIDIIAIGADSQMYHNLWDGKSWQRGWDSLGGSFTSLSPSLVSWGQDHLEAFGIDEQTSTLLRKTWNGDDWDEDWSALEGPTFDSPVVVDSWVGIRRLLMTVGGNFADALFVLGTRQDRRFRRRRERRDFPPDSEHPPQQSPSDQSPLSRPSSPTQAGKRNGKTSAASPSQTQP